MFSTILQKHILGHNFWTKLHRMMILMSRTMFWGPKNQMAPFILMVGHSVCPSVHPSVRPFCTSICLSSHCPRLFDLSVCPLVSLSVCPSICLAVRPSICPSTCMSICPLVCPSVHSSVCLTINLIVIHPSKGLSGLHWGLLLTVTGNCSCLV